MTKKFTTLTLGALGIVSLASACTLEAAVEAPSEEVGTEQGALVCANHQATDSLMADIAAAAARELGRWLPKNGTKAGDLDFDYTNKVIFITSTGNARCAAWKQPNNAPSNNCFYLRHALAYQSWTAGVGHGVTIHGEKFDFGVWQNRAESAWKKQMVCMDRPDNGMADNCPAEAHDLKYTGNAVINPATTCSVDYKFHAYKAQTLASPPAAQFTNQDLATADAAQLGNRLLWAGWDLPGVPGRNPWINFQSLGSSNVSIDPTPENEGGTTASSGGVTLVSFNGNATPQYAYLPSPVNVQGQPCAANPMICTPQQGNNPMTGLPYTCPTVVKYFKKRGPLASYSCEWATSTG